MLRRAVPFAMATGFLLSLAFAQDAAPPVQRDTQDLVFLGDSRPLLIRMHIRIDGKPFRDVWDDFLGSLFAYLDLNGDGVLNQAEIDRAPPPAILLQLLRGNYFDMPARVNTRELPEMQVNLVAGKVTRDGLATYYRLAGLTPFMAFIQDRASEADDLTEALFRELDRNKDGKLSKEELLDAETILRKLDLNDDEIISTDELVNRADDPTNPTQRNKVQILADSAFMLVGPGDSGRLAFALMSRYDKDQNEKLSRSEFNIDKALFDQLDADHDGELDTNELGQYLASSAVDLEVNINLGQAPAHGLSVDIANGAGAASPVAAAAQRIDSGALSITLGDAAIDLRASTGVPVYLESVRQTFTYQFQLADVTKRGFIDSKQADQNPALKALFVSADRDGDGKLTLPELTAYIDLLGKAVSSCAVLMVTDHGRGLFELLNTQHDGRLRPRELKQAWQRLSPWDKNGDGLIERSELPHQFQLYVSQGQPAGFALGGVAALPGATMDSRPVQTVRGPLWFRKMDRNGDGFVSLREFLGSKEDFLRIDADGDGLISPEEAEREDARVKKNGEKN